MKQMSWGYMTLFCPSLSHSREYEPYLPDHGIASKPPDPNTTHIPVIIGITKKRKGTSQGFQGASSKKSTIPSANLQAAYFADPANCWGWLFIAQTGLSMTSMVFSSNIPSQISTTSVAPLRTCRMHINQRVTLLVDRSFGDPPALNLLCNQAQIPASLKHVGQHSYI